MSIKNFPETADAPIHPGEILFLEYMEPLGLSQNRLADEIGVPPRRINEIVNGKRGITADTAVRLAGYFDTTENFWMNLQSLYELESVTSETRTKILEGIRQHVRAHAKGTAKHSSRGQFPKVAEESTEYALPNRNKKKQKP
jgi:addiction module HigA family antidote